jgi:glutathione peroxidase
MSATDFTFTSIDGTPLPLTTFAGRPILLVNVASACGFTPQYAGLQELHQKMEPRGLVVLGVPSNDFGAQEPGSESEIRRFCETGYGVSFPMTAKQKVIGAEAHPLYRWIADQLGEDAAPKWNFHKYLIGRDGELVDAWPSRVTPTSPPIVSAIEAALATS